MHSWQWSWFMTTPGEELGRCGLFSRASWPTGYLLSSAQITFPSVLQVEAVIHPQFLADLLSPEQQRDPLALIDELEQEEGLSLAQVSLGGRKQQNKKLVMILSNSTCSWMVWLLERASELRFRFRSSRQGIVGNTGKGK